MADNGGIPKKTISKVPTKEAYDLFGDYFNIEMKKAQ